MNWRLQVVMSYGPVPCIYPSLITQAKQPNRHKLMCETILFSWLLLLASCGHTNIEEPVILIEIVHFENIGMI
jgi:hypothetical protein